MKSKGLANPKVDTPPFVSIHKSPVSDIKVGHKLFKPGDTVSFCRLREAQTPTSTVKGSAQQTFKAVFAGDEEVVL